MIITSVENGGEGDGAFSLSLSGSRETVLILSRMPGTRSVLSEVLVMIGLPVHKSPETLRPPGFGCLLSAALCKLTLI